MDRRHFSRLNLNFQVEIQFQDKIYSGKILDLSLKGVLLELQDFPAQIDDNCVITIYLSEDVVMTFKSLLVHHEEDNFGFKFISADLDSMTHLRLCLQFNSDEPEKIEDELFFLVAGNR